jgi:DNA polymerase-3 subunit beta
MKISMSREEILPALQTINGVVERRQTLPILSNFLMAIEKDRLAFTATDMEVELVATIEKNSSKTGEITLPARKFLDICKALPEDAQINLEISNDRAVIVSGKSRFVLTTLPAQEYPVVEFADDKSNFQIPQGQFKGILDNTSFAMAQQDVRYYLNGLLLELGGNKLRAVATDGHRLALCDTSVESKQTKTTQVIVPRKGVVELSRLLRDAADDIEVLISSNHIRIDLDGIKFTSKLVDGKFPDYTRVIPPENDNPVVANKEQLRQCLTRASILSNEKYRGVRIVLERDKLRALAHNPEQEEAEVEIDVNYSGNEMEIGFNVSYLLDTLSIIKSENVFIMIADPNSSCLFLPENSTDSKFVVMPMRL